MYFKGLQSRVESLVTSFDWLFKLLHFIQVISDAGGNFVGVAAVSLVTDSSSWSIWNFRFESIRLVQDLLVILTGRKWPIDPYQFIVVSGHAKFIHLYF